MKNIFRLRNSPLRLSRSVLRRWSRRGILVLGHVDGKVCCDEMALLDLFGAHYDGESVNELELTIEDWCCAKVASRILHGATPRQMQSLREMGLLPSSKVGHQRFYLKRDCEALSRDRHIRFCITNHERFYK